SKPKPAAIPSQAATASARATEAAIQEAAAPDVIPGSSADGASPAIPFHKEGLLLAERMQMAAEMGGGLETNLFAAMAQTDCGACGWDCEGYAKALASGETKDVSLCTPGEVETLEELVKLMKGAGKEYEGV